MNLQRKTHFGLEPQIRCNLKCYEILWCAQHWLELYGVHDNLKYVDVTRKTLATLSCSINFIPTHFLLFFFFLLVEFHTRSWFSLKQRYHYWINEASLSFSIVPNLIWTKFKDKFINSNFLTIESTRIHEFINCLFPLIIW